jgi:hypothetical protein
MQGDINNTDELRLLAVFRALSASDRHALQAYAEFLAVRSGTIGIESESAEAPLQSAPRPEDESVVMAIRRLTRSYPMLDRRKLIGQTSQLMAEHALQGRAAAEVITELEVVFETHYRKTILQRET